MIRRPVPWPNGAKVAVAITFDMDADSHVHVEHSGRPRWHVHLSPDARHPHGHSSIPTLMGAVFAVSSLRAGIASGAYGAAKAALNQFSLCAAMEAAPYNVRINVVAPGAVETPGLNAATLKNETVKKTITDAIPMQRAATPEEVAQAISFLASDDASFITGIVLPVDGGKTAQLYVPAFDITNLDNQAPDR